MGFDFKKAGQSFDTLSFKNRFKAVASLLKNTITIIGRDKDIKTPWIRMICYHLVMVSCFFYALLGWWYDLPAEGWMLMLAILLFLYKNFYQNRQEARLSWIVYETIIGHDPSYKGSVKESKQIKSQIRKLAWVDIGMSIAKRSKSSEGGVLNFLVNLVISGLQEVWDLVNNYLLPSVAIDKMDIKPAVMAMKKLKDKVPETLVGVFGIDFIGSVVGRFMFPVYAFLVIIGLGLGYLAPDYFPSSKLPLANTTFTITYIPLVLAIFLGKLVSNIFSRAVAAVKVVYFTVFYTQITHPEDIADDLKEELLRYLKLDDVDEVDNLDQQDKEEK